MRESRGEPWEQPVRQDFAARQNEKNRKFYVESFRTRMKGELESP